MSEKHVLLRAQVMIEHDGQPYELEVTGLDGTKHRVQPGLGDVVLPPEVPLDQSPLMEVHFMVMHREKGYRDSGNNKRANEIAQVWKEWTEALKAKKAAVAPPREEVRALVVTEEQLRESLIYFDLPCGLVLDGPQSVRRLNAALAATNTAQHSPTQPEPSSNHDEVQRAVTEE